MRTSRLTPVLAILLAMNAVPTSFGRSSSTANEVSGFDSAGLLSILAPLIGGMGGNGLVQSEGFGITPVALSVLSQPQATEVQGAADGAEAGAGGGEGDLQNDANNPLTPKITVNFHNYYVPSYYGMEDREANQFLLRGLLPHKLGGAPQLLRFTLPFSEVPTFPGGTDSGLGDLTLMDLFVFKEGGMEFGVGPLLVLPTASEETTGAGKWQAGAAALAIAPQKWGIVGGLVTYQASFASQGGDEDRDDVSLLTVQPLVLCNLPEGFYLRSTAVWNFDLEHDTYYVPVGFGAGLVHQEGRVTINAFVEPQFTVLHDGVAPQWQVFAGLNFQIAF